MVEGPWQDNDGGNPLDALDTYGIRWNNLFLMGGAALVGLLVVGFLFFWTQCRISVDKGEFVPILKKTGKNMTNDMVVAPSPDFKGPQFEILKAGRHFRNPYYWWWPAPKKATVIDKGEVAVLVRKYGEDLPQGQVVAETEDQKGILREPKKPGRHYINTWAYAVEKHDMVRIKPGFRGVVTRLVGEEPENPNQYVVDKGEVGVQPYLLDPGTHPEYSNPYVYQITQIDIRSQKFEMSDQSAVSFPSQYGFDIKVEATTEWAPDLEMLPEVFVKYVDRQDLKGSGGINNIQRKVILPFARSLLRMIGGQHRAVDYITGDTRTKVQNSVEKQLRERCAEVGIDVRSFVIHKTLPPEQLREQYRRREVAYREIDRYLQEIQTEIGNIVVEGGAPKVDEKGRPVLNDDGTPVIEGGTPERDEEGNLVREGGRITKIIQELRKGREGKFGEVRAEIAEIIRSAEKYAKVEVTRGEKKRDVAEINLEAAKDKAAAHRAEGEAEAAVTVMQYEAEAEAVREKVSAFGSGDKYAEYQLIRKLSPGVTRILSNTQGSFAELFERFAGGIEQEQDDQSNK
ncbi:MAG: hypothetical protein KGZ25_00345 [Planctomycetes bacterium]|nr:hypothetical protein [Planctomycetota bacterium]